MGQVRCEICHLRLPTSKNLISHYQRGHSKQKLAREILKLSIFKNIPKILKKRSKYKTEQRSEIKYKDIKESETLFINDNVAILYRNNEIIIRDDKSSVDLEFSFDENSNETKENYFIPETEPNSKKQKDQLTEVNNNKISNNKHKSNDKLKHKNREPIAKLLPNVSSSSASSEDSLKKFSFKKRIRKRRDSKDNARHYKINISRLKNCETLDESTGTFYRCHCRDNRKLENTDLKVASDTESASDTGRNHNFNDLKVFCSKCGNGYRDENLLMEHMKIHETHCRVCNEIFPTEQQFKQHIQSHMFKVFVCHICNYEFPMKPMLHKHFECHVEDSILESVVDMEEDYNITPCTIPNMSYQSSINSILCYLGDNHDIYYYSNKLAKVYCDICLSEIYYHEYESHMQSMHCIYSY